MLNPLQMGVRKLCRRSRTLDSFYSAHVFRRGNRLPSKSLNEILDGAEDCVVSVLDVSQGTWSSPMQDGIILGKIIRFLRPQALLEVGTYRCFATSIMALNAPSEASITSVDIKQLNDAIHARLKSRVQFVEGEFSKLEPSGEKYDFVFVDADHQFESVITDSIRAFELLKAGGTIVWHDFAPWGLGTGYNGVPRALGLLGREIELCHIEDSNLVISVSSNVSTVEAALRTLKQMNEN
jgi:predicted O-methyltransferase YrrM